MRCVARPSSIGLVAENMPDKSITHVFSSHHHVDHSGGLRHFVAAGATAVMHDAAEVFFDDIFQTSSTTVPDTMEANHVEASIETVPGQLMAYFPLRMGSIPLKSIQLITNTPRIWSSPMYQIVTLFSLSTSIAPTPMQRICHRMHKY